MCSSRYVILSWKSGSWFRGKLAEVDTLVWRVLVQLYCSSCCSGALLTQNTLRRTILSPFYRIWHLVVCKPILHSGEELIILIEIPWLEKPQNVRFCAMAGYILHQHTLQDVPLQTPWFLKPWLLGSRDSHDSLGNGWYSSHKVAFAADLGLKVIKTGALLLPQCCSVSWMWSLCSFGIMDVYHMSTSILNCFDMCY